MSIEIEFLRRGVKKADLIRSCLARQGEDWMRAVLAEARASDRPKKDETGFLVWALKNTDEVVLDEFDTYATPAGTQKGSVRSVEDDDQEEDEDNAPHVERFDCPKCKKRAVEKRAGEVDYVYSCRACPWSSFHAPTSAPPVDTDPFVDSPPEVRDEDDEEDDDPNDEGD